MSSIDEFDVIHVFNPFYFPVEALDIIRFAKSRNIRVVTTPIFWFSTKYYQDNYPVRERIFIKTFYATRKLLFKLGVLEGNRYYYMKKILDESDTVLTNTWAEAHLVRNFFCISHNKFDILPITIDESFEFGDPSLFEKMYHLKDFILFVGNISRRKNVHRLINAFKKSKISTNLVIIGRSGDSYYYDLCRREATDKVFFIDHLPHASKMLKSAYKCAKVLALPSYFETPGLVALEGGLAGANVVITREGGTKEYFNDYAWYINPTDEKMIANALIEAYNAPRSYVLIKHLKENFSPEKVYYKLQRIYLDLLSHA
jgi:glycosyltransferase involved in cell wall biosynthesis